LENYNIESEDIKPMKGKYEGYFRMRVGKLRIVFYPDQEKKIIYVDAIGFRESIY
jgi:mRNA interferase RelE/StbE